MSVFRALLKKEFAAYFISPVAYVTLVSFLLLSGLSFWRLANMLCYAESIATARQWFFASPVIWFSMPVIIPLLTMRLFAQEKQTGTLETLMTAPVRAEEVVLAKFFGAMSFYLLLWLPAISYAVILNGLGHRILIMTTPVMLSGLLGVVLVGGAFVSLGMLTSILSNSQVVAALICFTLVTVIFFGGLYGAYAAQNDIAHSVGLYTCSFLHLLDFARGVVDSRQVVFYVTLTILFLFATTRVLDAHRWK